MLTIPRTRYVSMLPLLDVFVVIETVAERPSSSKSVSFATCFLACNSWKRCRRERSWLKKMPRVFLKQETTGAFVGR